MSYVGDPNYPAWMTEELRLLSETVDRFVLRECVPYMNIWRQKGAVPHETWLKAGEAGLLLPSGPAEFGALGGTFAHEAVILDRFAYYDASGVGIGLHNLGVGPYLAEYATDEQKRRWIPRMVSGELVGAIAMTEPSGGSDLKSIRTTAIAEGDTYVINGQKTFITLGSTATFLMLVCRTSSSLSSNSISLLMLETAKLEGFTRGKKLDTMGMTAYGTCELFFDNVRVPADCLLGEIEGQGFRQMMRSLIPERLISVIEAVGLIDRAMRDTIAYVRERRAFGKAIIEFQNTQFVLAECKTEATIARNFCNHCIQLQTEGQLDSVTAAMAKLWINEAAGRIVDRCLQLFGGYGYINDYPIAQMYKDARVYRIGGGTSEMMKLIIGRSL